MSVACYEPLKTPTKTSQIIAFYLENPARPYKDIAEQVGVITNMVYNVLGKYRRLQRGPEDNEGQQTSQPGQQTSQPGQQTSQQISRSGTSGTIVSRSDEIRLLYSRGLTKKQVAETLDVSYQIVFNALRKYKSPRCRILAWGAEEVCDDFSYEDVQLPRRNYASDLNIGSIVKCLCVKVRLVGLSARLQEALDIRCRAFHELLMYTIEYHQEQAVLEAAQRLLESRTVAWWLTKSHVYFGTEVRLLIARQEDRLLYAQEVAVWNASENIEVSLVGILEE